MAEELDRLAAGEPQREGLLAENRFVLTRGLYIEAKRALSRESTGKTAKGLGKALLVLVPVLAAGSFLLGLSPASIMLELLLLGVMALWLLWFFPRSNAKTAYRALLEGGKPPERVTRFYAGRLEIEGPGVHRVLRYSQLLDIQYTRHLVILLSDENAGVLLKKDGFIFCKE